MIFVVPLVVFFACGLCVNIRAENFSKSKLGPDSLEKDPAREMFQRLFKQRRAEHLEAIKGLLRVDSMERQYKMVSVIADKIFGVIQSSRATLEGSDYVPGGQFPQATTVRDALSSILENTALVSELILRLPDVFRPVLATHYDWEVLLQWSLGFAAETKLLDAVSMKLIHLVSQELGIIEADPNYINPYRKKSSGQESQENLQEPTAKKPKRKKSIKKGPQLTKHTEL